MSCLVTLTNSTGEVYPSNSTDNGIADIGDQDFSGDCYPGTIKSVPTPEVVLKIAFYVAVILVALGGNLLVIYVVWRNKRLHNTTYYYIVNLAVSDLMVTSFCTWVHLVNDLTEGWVLGAFFCKINSFSQVLALVSSILTMMLIACDRFFGVVFSMKAYLTDRRAASAIVLVWLCAAAISSPILVYREQSSRTWLDHNEIWCGDKWPTQEMTDPRTHARIVTHTARTFYYTFISVVLFFCPILVMSSAYAMVIRRLWANTQLGETVGCVVQAQDKTKKKVIVMLVVLLIVFAVCWLPFQISILYAEHRAHQSQLPAWYDKFHFFANYIAFANSAFNPIIYTGFNTNFRRGFKAIFMSKKEAKRFYNSLSTQKGVAHNSWSSSSNIQVTKI